MKSKADKNKDAQMNVSLPIPSSSELRGKQSVRATFKLTENAINAINIVSRQLGIKQKSVFDHLLTDYRSLDLIASEIEPERFEALDRVQKTFVLSRKTLLCLGEVSKRFDAPRDALVEYSVQRLLPIIAEERERHHKRKEILSELSEFIKGGEIILNKCRKSLGAEDPVYDKLQGAIRICRCAFENIQSFVEKGKRIEALNQEETVGSAFEEDILNRPFGA